MDKKKILAEIVGYLVRKEFTVYEVLDAYYVIFLRMNYRKLFLQRNKRTRTNLNLYLAVLKGKGNLHRMKSIKLLPTLTGFMRTRYYRLTRKKNRQKP